MGYDLSVLEGIEDKDESVSEAIRQQEIGRIVARSIGAVSS